MRQVYVGFYWTRAVPRIGFVDLPNQVEAAIRRSQTVRYQAEKVREFVETAKGELISEAVFMDPSPDRGTDVIEGPLAKLIKLCRSRRAKLLYVDFSARYRSRSHQYMKYVFQENEDLIESLHPGIRYLSTGKKFDPTKHFRDWQGRNDTQAPLLREQARNEVTIVMAALAGQPGGYQAAADNLNVRGIRTSTGRRWTAEGVRKTYKRHAHDAAQPKLTAPGAPILPA